MHELTAAFIFLFTVIDPIGSVPVFIAVTKDYNEREKRIIALKAILASAVILLFFIVVGELILDAVKISIPSFQIAGGIVIFLFALTMIFGDSKPESEISKSKNTTEAAIFPVAIPSIAGPGAMLAVVLLTKNSEYSIWQQFQTSLILFGVLAIVLVLLLLATKVQKIIGDAGASIISRVMGLILSALAVANIIDGIKESFNLL